MFNKLSMVNCEDTFGTWVIHFNINQVKLLIWNQE